MKRCTGSLLQALGSLGWFVLGASCASPTPSGTGVGLELLVPQITLDRLDNQLHLRIVPVGTFSCDSATGTLRAGTGPALPQLAGRDIRPDQRCDPTFWNAHRTDYGGEASPVDLCFLKTGSAGVDLLAGNYLVLVEGSGTTIGPGGVSRTVTLGSGCGTATVVANQTVQLTLAMIEQRDMSGVCGDTVINDNEECDPGSVTDTCNALCRFPERTVIPGTTMAMAPRRRISAAWAPDQNLVVGFDATGTLGSSEVFLHVLDREALPFTTPPSYVNDFRINNLATRDQRNLRLVSNSSFVGAVWESLHQDFSHPDIMGWVAGAGPAVPIPSEVFLDDAPNAGAAGTGYVNASIAMGFDLLAIVSEDNANGFLRMSTTALSSSVAPTNGTRVFPIATPGSVGVSEPRIVAVSDGFIAAWSSSSGNKDIFAAKFNTMGQVQGLPVQVNTQAGSDQDQLALAASGNDVIAAWRDASAAEGDTDGTTIRWRHFTNALVFDGPDRLGPTTTAGNQQKPTVSIGRNGMVLLAWENPDGHIRARQFRVDGSLVLNRFEATTDDFQLSASGADLPQSTGPRTNPVAVFGGSNLFAVLWEDAGDPSNTIHYRVLRDE